MKTLRYYQEEAHEALDKDINKGIKSLLLQLATGAGKTFLTTSYIEKRKAKNVLWLTHKEELIDQSAVSLMISAAPEELHYYLGRLYGKAGSSYIELLRIVNQESSLFDKNFTNAISWIKDNMGLIKQTSGDYDKKYVIASIQTAARRIPHLRKQNYEMIIIDEAHLALSKTWMSVCNAVPHNIRLGLTATPERMDGVAMDNLFQKISYVYDIRKGIEDKYLCNIRTLRVKTQISLDSVRTTGGELNNKDLAIVDCPERNNLICDRWLEHAKGRKTLCFAVNIAHAVNLCQVMKNRGIKADIVVSNTEICPDRRGAIREFTNGDTEILVNVEILTTGFDFENTGCILMARPTKSKNLYIQMIGRGTRLKDQEYVEKFDQEMLLIDMVDVTSRHALINAYSLDQGKRIEDRVFINEEEREGLIERRDSQPVERVSTIDRRTDSDTFVNLLELPEIDTDRLYAMSYQEPTAKQIEYLRNLGYDPDTTSFTKASAFTAIGNREATIKERLILKQLGYDISFGATHYQYAKSVKDHAERLHKQMKKSKKEFLKNKK